MKYFPNYVNKEDLFQVGCIGLIKAYKKYNQNLNVKFSSFAYKYIWGEMKKYIREDKSFKVNREISNVNYKINQAINLLSQKLMREPSLEEVSRYLEIPINIINLAIGSVKPVQSLDEVVTDEDSFSLYELIPSKEYDIDTNIMLQNSINNLSEEERRIIELRYYENRTQTEIANSIGKNQTWISREEQKILVKLKNSLSA